MTWFFLTAAIISLILELTFGVLYFLILSLAFSLTAISSYFFNLNATWCIVIASIFSLIGVFAVYFWKKQHSSLKNIFQDLDVGQPVIIKQKLANGMYYVQYRGTQWQAKLVSPTTDNVIGQSAIIIKKEANLLWLELSNE